MTKSSHLTFLSAFNLFTRDGKVWGQQTAPPKYREIIALPLGVMNGAPAYNEYNMIAGPY